MHPLWNVSASTWFYFGATTWRIKIEWIQCNNAYQFILTSTSSKFWLPRLSRAKILETSLTMLYLPLKTKCLDSWHNVSLETLFKVTACHFTMKKKCKVAPCTICTCSGRNSPASSQPHCLQTVTESWACAPAIYMHTFSFGRWFWWRKKKSVCPVSPLGAILVTWFTVTFLGGVLEDEPSLAIVHPSRARRHAVWTVSKVGARRTFICALKGREERGQKRDGYPVHWSDHVWAMSREIFRWAAWKHWFFFF